MYQEVDLLFKTSTNWLCCSWLKILRFTIQCVAKKICLAKGEETVAPRVGEKEKIKRRNATAKWNYLDLSEHGQAKVQGSFSAVQDKKDYAVRIQLTLC